jgi:hypothetical protein
VWKVVWIDKNSRYIHLFFLNLSINLNEIAKIYEKVLVNDFPDILCASFFLYFKEHIIDSFVNSMVNELRDIEMEISVDFVEEED